MNLSAAFRYFFFFYFYAFESGGEE